MGTNFENKGAFAVVVVVAASNSLNQAAANYVCDGVDDEVEINLALNAAATLGGIVQLLDGLFNTGHPIVLPSVYTYAPALCSGITLCGQGKGTVIKLQDNSDCNVIEVGDGAQHSEGLRVMDLFIDGNKTHQGAGSWHGVRMIDDNIAVELIRVEVISCHGSGFLGHDCRFSKIINCYAGGCDEYGLYMMGSMYHSWVEGGLFAANGLDGIRIDAQRAVLSGTDCTSNIGGGIHLTNNYATVDGCRLWDEAGTPTQTFGVHIDGGEYVTVTGCFVYNMNGYGIRISGTAYYNTITGNIIKKCTYGIASAGSYNTIVGNTTEQIGYFGIEINGPYHVVANNVISGPSQVNPYYGGIVLYTDADHTIVIGNICRKGAYANQPRYGVDVYAGATNCIVARNNLADSGTLQSIRDLSPDCVVYGRHSEVFMDVLAASTNHCGSWVGTGVAQEIVAGITQPDVPRNLTVSCTNNAAPSGNVVIEGVSAKGTPISETFTIVPGGTATGNRAFATISKITIPATVDGGSADTVSVGIGSKMGLADIIYAIADVYKVKKNNADWALANYTANATYDTVDVSTGGAIIAGEDFTIWYGTNLNIV